MGDAEKDGGSLAKECRAQDQTAALPLPLWVTLGACWKDLLPFLCCFLPRSSYAGRCGRWGQAQGLQSHLLGLS